MHGQRGGFDPLQKYIFTIFNNISVDFLQSKLDCKFRSILVLRSSQDTQNFKMRDLSWPSLFFKIIICNHITLKFKN